jgi:hypothetical protein
MILLETVRSRGYAQEEFSITRVERFDQIEQCALERNREDAAMVLRITWY